MTEHPEAPKFSTYSKAGQRRPETEYVQLKDGRYPIIPGCQLRILLGERIDDKEDAWLISLPAASSIYTGVTYALASATSAPGSRDIRDCRIEEYLGTAEGGWDNYVISFPENQMVNPGEYALVPTN